MFVVVVLLVLLDDDVVDVGCDVNLKNNREWILSGTC